MFVDLQLSIWNFFCCGVLDPLKAKIRLKFKTSVHTSMVTQSISATETNELMQLRKVTAAYCENHMKYTLLKNVVFVSESRSYIQ
jgi:hypothetical protein